MGCCDEHSRAELVRRGIAEGEPTLDRIADDGGADAAFGGSGLGDACDGLGAQFLDDVFVCFF